ncbi:MAG TPA: carbohydrate porin [Thermodesulfovibrionales bacterium]|jgi:porin|nr:carbohydrate porin [Thermodesulfovibrionales bacterium]
MKRRQKAFIVTIVFQSLGIFFCTQAFAQEGVQTYSGDLWSRSTLTGDWGGARNDLAKKGVTLDLNLTQIGQGNVSGGKSIGWEYGGRGNLTLNLDTQKMGLWPGGFLTVEAEGTFGNSINAKTGSLMAVNSNQIYPMPNSDQFNIPNVTFTQFFSHYVGVTTGKMDTTSGDANEFAHGKGDTQFFNLAFNINPVALVTVPYSTLGAGLIVLPTSDPNAALITVMAMSSDGRANSDGFNDLFKGNTTYAASGRLRTDFFGMTGHQSVTATYSTKNYTSISQSLRLFVENRSIQEKDNSWSFFYNFDQYVYEPRKGSGQGIGMFGRFGASDGNPNPVHYFFSIGLGGKGVIPRRPLDEFGLGYYYMDVKNPNFTGPRETREFLRDEQGFEAYYSFAITPWMKLSPDIQVIRPSQKEVIKLRTGDILGRPVPTVVREDIDTAVVPGLRLQVIF